MDKFTLKQLLEIVGFYLIWTGFWDAWKYHWQSNSIKKIGIAKGHSRKFINVALHNDHMRTIYLILVYLVYGRLDWFLLSSSLVAIFTMTELWFVIYLYYPYRMRGCPNFKRPNILLYVINSLQPNRIRKRL
jgi:hypothetical protein